MACTSGKKSFKTLGDAQYHMLYIYRCRAYKPLSNNRDEFKLPLGIYLCAKCGEYHLTSTTDNRSTYMKERCFDILSGAPKTNQKKILKLNHHATKNRFQNKSKKTAQTNRHQKSWHESQRDYKRKRDQEKEKGTLPDAET